MTYLPDPTERLESRVDDLASEWAKVQGGVPEGSHRCPYCSKIFNYEPVAASSRPDSPVMCYDCLSKSAKKDLI